MVSVRSLLPSRAWPHSERDAPVSTRRASPAPAPALLPYVYMLIATMCLLMGSMSIVVCAVCLKTFLSFRNENEYLNAFIQRQDGWALAQKGVPALMVGGSFADLELMQKFLGSDYHGPDDELTDKTELGGAADDADLHIALGRYFADARKYKSKKAGD